MPLDAAPAPATAVIDEAACIGCALCLEACPVDAIVGAHKFMHTVIREECTGCRWCLPVCPVDCISMADRAESWMPGERARRAAQYRRRHEARQARLMRDREDASRLETAEQKKLATVERAMQRASQRLRQRRDSGTTGG
jgi:electron transport complex protein RnfB